MKAQLSIDYIVSLIVFILFGTYIFFQVTGYTPAYITQIETQRLRSEAYQISELLVNDPGEPLNWEVCGSACLERIGLSDYTKNKTNFLSRSKIDKFDEICNQVDGYAIIKSLIDTDRQFSIILNKADGETLISCSSSSIFKPKFEIRRIVTFDSSYGELIVQV